MKFCTYQKCPHYSKATKYDRACYYGEPQCWKGWLDLIGFTLWLATFGRFQAKRGGRKVQLESDEETLWSPQQHAEPEGDIDDQL